MDLLAPPLLAADDGGAVLVVIVYSVHYLEAVLYFSDAYLLSVSFLPLPLSPSSSLRASTATEQEHASTEHCYRACVIQYFS